MEHTRRPRPSSREPTLVSEGLRFHDVRHTGATLAAASGAPLRALMHRMGHNSAAAAIRYQHVLDGQDVAIADYLDDLIARGTQGATTRRRRRGGHSRFAA